MDREHPERTLVELTFDNDAFLATHERLVGFAEQRRLDEVRDLSFQSVAGSGNALVVSLQKRGLIASFDGGKTWQHMDDQFEPR